MDSAYKKIVRENVRRLFEKTATRRLELQAFGKPCVIRPDGILLDGKKEEDVLGILISLYALHAGKEEMVLEPFHAFKDLPHSAPYAGAFATRTQQVLVPHVEAIQKARETILGHLGGTPGPASVGGDFSFVLYPFLCPVPVSQNRFVLYFLPCRRGFSGVGHLSVFQQRL